jgi:4-alpha-glucanotransferase
MITAIASDPIELPLAGDANGKSCEISFEDGRTKSLRLINGHRGLQLAGIDQVGYHSLLVGGQRISLAVAPPRCTRIEDLTGKKKTWGLTAQIYALRSVGDCGIGDTRGVTKLAAAAAQNRADILGLSPVHALFAADPNHFSPYSPSNRLFYNPLHADARTLFDNAQFATALTAAGVDRIAEEIEENSLIDWPRAAQIKMSIFRQLFADFRAGNLTVPQSASLAAAFTDFRKAGGEALERHACFETLHAHHFKKDPTLWNWHSWEAPWRDPASREVVDFAKANDEEIAFHCFLQWIASSALGSAQHAAKEAGMGVGLIADLAVGMTDAGSHAWSNPDDILDGLEIGAPPDLYNANGQNWGLTTFSPRALNANGFAPYLGTLRASLKHAGGLRIDHVMGLQRLWVVPRGADPKEGAYLSYPFEDMLRIIALESHRHRAIIIGEDLGTVPAGLRERLARASVYGTQVLFFERAGRYFKPPQQWSSEAMATSSTHDMPTVGGWWRGADIATRAQLRLIEDQAAEQATRVTERRMLWRAFRRSNSAGDKQPPSGTPQPAVDAAAKFLAQTEAPLTLLPIEDALGLDEQTNVPGTVDQYPNWRRRYPGQASTLLDPPEVKKRLAPLIARRS